MTVIRVSILALFAFGLVCRDALGFELVRPGNFLCYYTSEVDGTEQPYFVYIPTTYDPDRPSPVVFSLHGFGGRTYPAA
ncbi:MAG: hypothetical protein HY318_13105, partial [Armatimonadetes bacterium]|nr:hypothetical protein [Armatimonadota bacterium]